MLRKEIICSFTTAGCCTTQQSIAQRTGEWKRLLYHGVIHPRREEGVDGGRVDQLSVIGKNTPEEQNDKLTKGTQLLSGRDPRLRYGFTMFLTMPTGKTKTEKRKSLHRFRVLSGWG